MDDDGDQRHDPAERERRHHPPVVTYGMRPLTVLASADGFHAETKASITCTVAPIVDATTAANQTPRTSGNEPGTGRKGAGRQVRDAAGDGGDQERREHREGADL